MKISEFLNIKKEDLTKPKESSPKIFEYKVKFNLDTLDFLIYQVQGDTTDPEVFAKEAVKEAVEIATSFSDEKLREMIKCIDSGEA